MARRMSRRRRPNWPALAVLFTIVLGGGWLVARGLDDSRDRVQAYVDEVRPAIDRSNEQAADLASIRRQLPTADTAVVERQTSRLARDSEDVLHVVLDVDPPGRLRTAHGLLLAAMAARHEAARSMRSAALAALGEGPLGGAVARMASVGKDVAVSDRAYELFARAVQARKARAPRSSWTGTASWDEERVRELIAVVRARHSATPVHDTSVVTFTMDPAPAGFDKGVQVLPATGTLRLSIVVADIGNKPERHVEVLAELTGPGGNMTDGRQFVDLTPGQRRTVVIGVLHPTPGGQSTLRVRVLPVDGETSTADNEKQTTFIVH